jgi:ClpP class serine protease
VCSRRGARIGATDDLFTGEVWTGARAAELGLVDRLGTLRGVLSERYPGAEITTVEPRKPLLARLGVGGPVGAAATALATLEALEQRAAWSRFGL